MILLFLAQLSFASQIGGSIGTETNTVRLGQISSSQAIMESINRPPDTFLAEINQREKVRATHEDRLHQVNQEAQTRIQETRQRQAPKFQAQPTETIVNNAKLIRLDLIPDPDLPDELKSTGQFHDRLRDTFIDLSKMTPVFDYQKRIRSFGLVSVGEADSSYFNSEFEDAEFYQELAQNSLDIAVGIDPITGFGRSAYEAATGLNLVTGKDLNHFERGLAFAGVISGGSSRTVHQLTRGILKLSGRFISVTRFSDVIEVGKKILKGTAEVANPIPSDGWFARVVPKDMADSIRSGVLRLSESHETFVTAYEDISKFMYREKLAVRLSLFDDLAGTEVRNLSEHTVIRFKFVDDFYETLSSPINNLKDVRKYGFVHGGLTQGGAREWLIDSKVIRDKIADVRSITIEDIL